MKLASIILFSIILLTVSCCKEDIIENQIDNNGVVISLPSIWKKSLHLNGVVSNDFVQTAIYYNGNIVIPTTNGGTNRRITLANPNNGDYIWHWDDRYQPATEYSDFDYYHQYNNLLTWQNGKRSYCVNLTNGNTEWKFQRAEFFDNRIQPFKSQFYFNFSTIVNSNGNKEYVVLKSELQNGLPIQFIRANLSSSFISPDGYAGGIIYANEVPNNENKMLVTFYEPLPNSFFNTFYGLFDLINNVWIWNRKLLAVPKQSSGVNMPPIIYQDKIFTAISNSIVCHDINTGDKLWQKDFNGDFMFSGFIIEESKIIANCEDTFTYCLNPVNGETLWKTQSSGTSGKMSYLNGVIYFVGGSSDKLHAIDVANGKMLWKIDAEKLGEPSNSGFKTNAVYVFPAENNKPAKVIALSHLNVYCFEAYK